MRADMHPADQVEAFARLVSQGSTAAEIAARFGMSERAVEQRLRLGNVSPMLLEAYREGNTNLDTLKAFALTTDQKLQEEIWNNLHETRGYVGDYLVREILLDEHIRGSARIAEFVGVEEYEKAGGRVTRDLFASEDNHGIWLENPALVYDLADRKLAAIADELKEDWKWVEFDLEFGYEKESKFNKIYPVKGELTPDEKASMKELTSRLEQIHEAGVSDETREEFNSVHQQIRVLNNLKASRNTYTEEQREIAGCVVTIDYNGKARIYEGLVRPEDMPKAGSKASDDVTWRDPEKKVRAQTGYSKKLMDEMRVERTKVVRSHLSGAFKEAFDLLLFQMCREIFCVERYFSHALDVELFRIGSRHGATDEIDVDSLPLDWIREEDDAVGVREDAQAQQEEEGGALRRLHRHDLQGAAHGGHGRLSGGGACRRRPEHRLRGGLQAHCGKLLGAHQQVPNTRRSPRRLLASSGLTLTPRTRRRRSLRRWKTPLPLATRYRRTSPLRAGLPRLRGRHRASSV